MKRLLSVLLAGLTVSPAVAVAAPTMADWLMTRAPEEASRSQTLDWNPQATRIQVADPIVFPRSLNSDWVTIPNHPGRFQVLLDGPPYHEPSAALLTFADAEPTCSRPAGILGVDVGMAAFQTESAQQSIMTYLETLPEGWTLYDGLIYDQNGGDRNLLTLFPLPDDVEFAGFSTGGDGGFSVSSLYCANGGMLALLVDLSRSSTSAFSLPSC